jgi:RNase P/RNase MRP subunit p29
MHDLMFQVKKGAAAISLIKGMRVKVDGPQLISQMVERCERERVGEHIKKTLTQK